ncbi:Hypothetical_protein [Hexamita inflata]|uniref:Hypothetical_protein n=1 Tax=Hexamita inflata TaxID=28002 RepID=A0AA86UI10_9EUKA|nr:Hypothetical protein HINF_LOCUS38088 [Hexamita inflata]CAI9958960.1 Hypothetical protein HINF_LOCUS46605 [Hexamita inflata]
MNNQIEQLKENMTEDEVIILEMYVNRPIFQAYLQKRPDFNPNMLDEHFGTIAMFKLVYELEIEESLSHDPNIQNNEGKTIEILCHDRDIEPQRWMICFPNIKDQTNNSMIQYRKKTVRPLTKKLRNIQRHQCEKANKYVSKIESQRKLTYQQFIMTFQYYYRYILRAYDNIPNYQPYEYIL